MTKTLAFIIFVVCWAAFIYGTCRLFARGEAKDWNGGICPKCGKPLKHFDNDSQGGHGWCCHDCDYYTWVSYHRWVYKTKKKEQ